MSWRYVRLKRLFERTWGGSWGEESNGEGFEMSCIRGTDFDFARLRASILRSPVRKFTELDVKYRSLRSGDLVIEKSGGGEQQPVGRAVMYNHAEPAIPTNFAAGMRPVSGSDGRFLTYLLASLYSSGVTRSSIKQTTGIQNLDLEDFLATKVLVVGGSTQRAIADFLDAETARIDSLVALKTRMLELVDEKVLSAAEAWLSPDSGTRDSAAPGFGWIPDSWGIRTVRSMFELGRGRVLSHDLIAANPGVYPVYSSQTASDGCMGYIDSYAFDGEYLTWTTDGAKAGTVFHRNGRFNCTNVCGTLKAKTEISYAYSRIALMQATRWFVRHDINPKLMNDVMGSIRIPVPPLDQQETIAAQIGELQQRADNVRRVHSQQITLLTERKQALIAAAVTGQLDLSREIAEEAS